MTVFEFLNQKISYPKSKILSSLSSSSFSFFPVSLKLMENELKLQIKSITQKPGVYQYFDKNGEILYVGKAKNLKKRVNSYFTKEHENAKTRILVRKIHSIKTIVVETEFDALLLENNLIKKLQPRYNIMLKDDKTYPWLCIKKERFPRVFRTRKLIKDGSEYFGSYTSVKQVDALLELIKELYPLRSCNFDLSEEKVNAGKYKVCLEYHLGNCLGACEGLQTEQEYNVQIKSIKNIIKGNFNEVVTYMHKIMQQFSEQLEFEKAQQIKDKLDLLKKYQVKSTVVNPSINNVDVFSIVTDESYGYVNFLKISNGAIIQSFTTEIKKMLSESKETILESAIIEIRNRFHSTSNEIYTPFKLNFELPNVKLTVPKIGDKKRIVELSERNAKYYRIEQLKQIKIVDPDRHVNRIMAQMKSDLRMPVEPRYIEGFDNSNLQGTNPVSACVVFKNGKPSKKDYRIFNVKSVEGPDDFASMTEVIYRRYSRLIKEESPLPQLIVIDGGKGQLSAALKSLDELGLRGKITIIGIAKRLEEIYFPNDSIPLYLDKTSESLKVLQHIRNESHRFGITKHRNRRSKDSLDSELDHIPGIGKQTILKLLKHFKSVKRIKSASLEELTSVISKDRATKVYYYFNSK